MAKATQAKNAPVAETPVEKAVEKKTVRKPAVRTAAKKIEEVYVQFGGMEWNLDQLKAQAKEAYVAEGGKASGIKQLNLYVKPEEGKAYYVINGSQAGSIALW